jgi:capsular exopolysaccharide synthesis family protein
MYLNPNAARQPAAAAEPLLDLPRIMRIARRHLRLMAVIFLGILAAAAAATLSMRPVYTASAQLMIDKPAEKLLSKDDDGGGALAQSTLDSSIIETEVEVLRSPALAESVVRDLQLDRDPEFNPALAPPGPLARAKGFVLSLVKPPSHASGARPRDPVADTLEGHLKVSRTGTSYIIRLDVTSRDPAKAARIANAFARNYLNAQLESKFGASHDANTWLYSRIGDLRQRVADAETALQNYKIQNNLLSAQGATLTEQQISNLDQQAALTRAQDAEAQARLTTAMRQLAGGSSGDDVGETLNSPVIQQLRQQRATISQRVANLQTRYGTRHPDLLKARGELADVDAQIEGEIKRIISNLQAQAAVAHERETSLQQSVAQSRQTLADTNRSMVRLNELQRDADAERTLYESFLSKFKEMSAEAGLARTDAHIVSPARTPTAPSAPRTKLNLLLGAVLGLAAATSAALAAELMERGLTDAETVERELSAPYLGSVPSLSSIASADDPLRARPIDHLVAKPMSSFAEAFRSLRAAIEFSRLGSRMKVLAVTSSLAGEGKTTTSLGLARSAALAGVRTVVVDCDLRQHAINGLLEVSPRAGLIDVLNGSISLDEALVLDEMSGAMVLPLVEAHFTPKDMFNSPAMATVLDELKRRFDLVILDSPPVILVTEARTVARQADAVLLLVRWRQTPRVLVETALRLLAAAGVTLAGVALTRVDLRRPASVDPADPTAYYLSHKNYYLS